MKTAGSRASAAHQQKDRRKALSALLVEDSEPDAELLLRSLEQSGYEVTHLRVETREAMLAALTERRWDIVLSDYSMPRFSAPEALRTLKEAGLDLPFIIVSGTIGEDIAVDALKNGAHDFLIKGRLARLAPAIERELADVEARRSRREAEAARRASDARFRAIMEAVTDAVVATDASGRIEYVNPAAERLFDYGPGELVGKSFAELLLEREPGAAHDELAQLADEGASRSLELFGRRRDGTELSIEVSLGRWTSGDESFFAAIVRDLTERKKVEAQLMTADRMVAVGTLAAGVAHEINNPLAAILANLDLALQDLESLARGPTPDVLRTVTEELEDARDAGDRVRKIVRDLRIFSRSEEDVAAPVNVEVVMESSLRIAQNQIRHRARVVRDYGHVPPVLGSESRLGQVFLNLVINASQAIKEGSALDNEIRICTAIEGPDVVVEVADTGSGIPASIMRQLFTPFLTTKPPGVGTGLGLSICQRIVTTLGGEISARNLPGRGAAFRVRLPSADGEAKRSVRPVATPSQAPRRGRILVVDDEPLVATVVSRVLASEHEVVALNRAKDALDRVLAGEQFDVILCDLMMPDVNGMDFYRELERQAPEQAEGLVFVTGGAFTPSARRFLDGVKNLRLEKPFDPEHLRTLINTRMR